MGAPMKRKLPAHGKDTPKYRVSRKAYVDGVLVGPGAVNGDEAYWTGEPASWMTPVNEAAEAKVKAAGKGQEPKKPTLDDLRKEAQSFGIEVDNRWGEPRLMEEIAKAKAPA